MKLKNYLTLSGLITLLISNAEAAAIDPPPLVQAPALDEWGLIGLAALLGAVGLITLFKHK
jgi:hypothetical protein